MVFSRCRLKTSSLLALLLMLPAIAQARPLTEIKKTKELRVCLSPLEDYLFKVEPANCKEKCKYSGVAYDSALIFAKSIGVKLGVRVVSWDEQFFNDKGVTLREATYTPELLATGKCDLYTSNVTKNEWRLKKMDFMTLFPNRMLVVVKKNRKKEFTTQQSLGGKTIATVKDTSYHTWLEVANSTTYKNNPIKIMLVADGEMVPAVTSGKADATMLDYDYAVYVTEKKARELGTAIGVGDPQEVGWAARKDSQDLQAAVKEFFKNQMAEPQSELNSVWNHYFGVTLKAFVAAVSLL
jgi:membrane-bound lytic murein transglycosylase F